MKTFTSYKLKNLELKNRIVMPPMCMYSSDEDGQVKDFHLNHYASRAIGGTGLIIVEATAIVPKGRITSNDLGIWDDSHIEGLRAIVDSVHTNGSKIGIQLAHAGRKCTSNDEFIVAPSAIRHSERYREPRELSKDDIEDLFVSYKKAARRANEAGFDLIEVHAAHGYLIHEFLSPISNHRKDEYGGNLENRLRFLKNVLNHIGEVWPKEKAIIVRVSADDYVDGGIDIEEMVRIVDGFKDQVNMIHVSSGGLVDARISVYPSYQVNYADTIKRECNIDTIAVGLIHSWEQVEEILNNKRADLVAIGRGLLRNPYLPLNMAFENDINIEYPEQYVRGFHK